MQKTSTEKVKELLNLKLGNKPWKVKPFGDGRFSETFMATSGNEDFIIRVAPPDSLLQLFYEYRMMRQEPSIHEMIRKNTSVPVPRIIAYDFSRDMIDRDYLIMPRIPGLPMSSMSVTYKEQNKILEQLGEYLKQIHDIKDKEGRFGYLGAHHCMEPQKSWAEAFKMMYRKELDDIVKTGICSEKKATKTYNVLIDHLNVFTNCNESHLLHGDLWVANILIDDKANITGLLDFDRACWGDPEWDLAIAEYCGLINGAFWKGYGHKINTSEGDAAIRRMFYLLYEHQKYIVISMSSRRNNPAGAKQYALESSRVLEHYIRSGEIII